MIHNSPVFLQNNSQIFSPENTDEDTKEDTGNKKIIIVINSENEADQKVNKL